MLEYEKKFMLTENEYFAIMELMCRREPWTVQTNHYFDTDDYRMNEQKITCRIREKNGIYKTVIKNHGTKQTDCSIEVELAQVSEFDPQIFKALGLRYQGNLVTERIVVYKDSRCKMVLDRNTYLGNTDFELEIEYREGEEQHAQTVLKDAALALISYGLLNKTSELAARVSDDASKSQRFFDRLKNLK